MIRTAHAMPSEIPEKSMFRFYPTRIAAEARRTHARLLTLTLLAARYQLLLRWASRSSDRLSPSAQQRLDRSFSHREQLRGMPLRGPPTPGPCHDLPVVGHFVLRPLRRRVHRQSDVSPDPRGSSAALDRR
jgi:hypothetical protein